MAQESGATNLPGMILIDISKVKQVLTMQDTLAIVEKSFALQAQGKAVMPAKIYLDLVKRHGDFRAMPAYIDGAAGMKWVSVFPGNREHNLPTVLGTIILSDPATGATWAIVEGSYITEMRTGATGGVAVKYLARKDSAVVGLIGAGVQAKTQLMAIKMVLPGLKEVKVFDINQTASIRFAEEMSRKLELNVTVSDSVEQAASADVIVTTTPSTKPILLKRHVKPGTHINAIGADAAGKQELEIDILKGGKIIVDDVEQASHSGEINVGISRKALGLADIHSTLGQVVAGMEKGRVSEEEITIFDSTGLAIQDICCASFVYEKLRSSDLPVYRLL
jgi:alanine dehydrogenase